MFVVTVIVPGAAAAQSNELQIGDHVLKIDGICLDRLSVEEIRALLHGPPKAQITITTMPAKRMQNSKDSAQVNLTSFLTPKTNPYRAPLPSQYVDLVQSVGSIAEAQSNGDRYGATPSLSGFSEQVGTDQTICSLEGRGSVGLAKHPLQEREGETETAQQTEQTETARKGECAELSEDSRTLPSVSDAVAVVFDLFTNMKEAGEEGSTRRAVFNIKLAGDLSKATGIYSRFFSITSLRFETQHAEERLLVQVEIAAAGACGAHEPKAVAEDLLMQAQDQNSLLRGGVITQKLAGAFESVGSGNPERRTEEEVIETSVSESVDEELARRQSRCGTVLSCNDDGMAMSCSAGKATQPTIPDSLDEMMSRIGFLESELAAKEAEFEREKQRDEHKFETALAMLEQRMETKYTQLIWKQVEVHEQVVQDLLSRIRDSDTSLPM